jgi:hypothetical protein
MIDGAAKADGEICSRNPHAAAAVSPTAAPTDRVP